MFWTFLVRLVTRSLGIATTLVLARLIAPAEYGVFSTILVATAALNVFTNLTVLNALVQMPKDPQPYFSTAWTVDLVRPVGFYVIIFVVAPYWCALFHVPEATAMLRVLGIGQLITGFRNVGIVMLDREFRFNRVFAMQAAEAVTYSIFVVVAGVVLRNAWALVIGLLAGFSARVVASYIVTPFRARLGFEWTKFREMYRFSGWTNGYNIVDFLLETSDNAVVAFIVGPTALAEYRMGYQIATEGPLALQWMVTGVMFPAFATIQSERVRVTQTFRGLIGLVGAVLFPITAALVALGPVAVPLLLGQRWSLAAQPLQILAGAGLIRGLLNTSSPLLLGLGLSRRDFLLRLTQALLMLALIYPAGLFYGMNGVAFGVLGAACLSLPLWAGMVTRAATLGSLDILMPLLAPALASALPLVTLLVLRPEVTWAYLLGEGFTLAAGYVGISAILFRWMPSSGLAAALQAAK